MKIRTLLALALLIAILVPLSAADWPQYNGPARDGVSKEKGLLKEWPKAGPKLVWTAKEMGVGYSAPSIVGDRLYILGGRGTDEFLIAADVATGKEVWSAKIGPLFTWKGNNWNAGPSSSATVDGDMIYALGGQGILICVDKTGKEVWRKDMAKDLGGAVNPIGGGPKNIGWGWSWSPLVDGDNVICQPGGAKGTLAALNKKTGAEVWRSKGYTDQASYASTIAADFGGTHQYINLTNEGLTGVNANDGSMLWRYERAYNDCVIPTPIVVGDTVYCTVGFGLGCDLVKINAQGGKFTAEKVWANRSMANQNGGVVAVDSHVYGHSGRAWSCQELKTGKVVWSDRRALRDGAVIYAEGNLYCYGERDGKVVLVPASPKGWTEKGRFEIPEKSTLNKPSGRIWTHPVIANGKLYLRDQELLFCYDIAAAKGQ